MCLEQKLKIAADVKKKKTKSGFTLVELVIVIAILAILAAIAIPVINTTIRSAKLSAMESDCATVNMLVKEAVNTSKIHMAAVRWNNQTIYSATINDVCIENQIKAAPEMYKREIGNTTYYMVWTPEKSIKVSGDGLEATGTIITGDETIASLDPEGD